MWNFPQGTVKNEVKEAIKTKRQKYQDLRLKPPQKDYVEIIPLVIWPLRAMPKNFKKIRCAIKVDKPVGLMRRVCCSTLPAFLAQPSHMVQKNDHWIDSFLYLFIYWLVIHLLFLCFIYLLSVFWVYLLLLIVTNFDVVICCCFMCICLLCLLI